MQTIEEAMDSIRQVETGGDYARQQKVSVGGRFDTKVGAYGILLSRWEQVAAEAGVPGADWRDPAAQDSIVRQKLERDYRELGNWEMVGLAFRYGTNAARKMVRVGYIEPKAIADSGYPNMAQYLRNLRTYTPDVNAPVEGTFTPGEMRPAQESAPQTSPQNKRAEDIVRGQLRAMLNAQQQAAPAPEETESAIPDQDTSAIPDQDEELADA